MMLDLRLRMQRALQGRYQIEHELGRGGMAVVFRATSLQDGSAVAVKVLLPTVVHTLGVARFLREVTLAGSLEHPNILAIIEAGDAEGTPFYVMPFIDGASLRARLTPRIEHIAEAISITAQVADALSHAHARGIVHRDIKPENLLMRGAQVVVTDFGVAKALNDTGGSSLTNTGFTVGSPEYMSPEQVAGDPDLDGRSDIYSLGLVLYEMLGGAVPFKGDTAQQLMASRFVETPRDLRELRADIPDALVAVIKRMMAVSASDRHADAAEAAADLRAIRG